MNAPKTPADDATTLIHKLTLEKNEHYINLIRLAKASRAFLEAHGDVLVPNDVYMQGTYLDALLRELNLP